MQFFFYFAQSLFELNWHKNVILNFEWGHKVGGSFAIDLPGLTKYGPVVWIFS